VSLGLVFIALCGLKRAAAEEVTVTGRVTLIDPTSGEASDNANVVVWLAPLSDVGPIVTREGSLPTSPHLRLVQKHRRFTPHLLVVRVGSVVEFPNLDPFFHNVFSLFEGKRFDLGLYEAGTTRAVNFDAPGICYIFCNIHPEMSAVVVVLKTPYYARTNRAGELSIPSVPLGRYDLQVWHERCKPEILKSVLTVSHESHSVGEIHLNESRDLMLAHKNKYGRDYDEPTPSSPLYEQP